MAPVHQRKGGKAGAGPASADADDVKKDVATAAATARHQWGWADGLLVLVLAALAAVTRFWRIHDPKGIIFDEAHFNKFSTWYVSQHYYVDIHPPLAKLAFAALLWVGGFVGAQEDKVRWWVSEQEGGFIGTKDWLLLYEDGYGWPAEWGQPYLALRRLSATMGVIFVVVTFLSARAIGLGRVAATLAAWCAGCELVVLLQSRAILCDIFLYTFNMATIGASFASQRLGLTESQRVRWCLITGLLLGCALSVKLTALGTLAVVGVHQALCLLSDPSLPVSPKNLSRIVGRGMCRASCILLPASVVFFGLWIAHLEILQFSGQGDNFMIDEFKRTLRTKPPHGKALPPPDACPNFENQWSDCGYPGINEQQCLDKGCCWDPESTRAWCYHLGPLERPSMPLWPKIKETLRATWANNNGGAVMEHPFMSEWYEWPTMDARTVPFAATHEGGQLRALGNPAVWWGVWSNFLVVTGVTAVAGALLASLGKGASGAVARALGKAPAVPAEADDVGSVAPAAVAGVLTAPSELDTRGWVVPLVVLWSGYLLNLVPYTLIARSKFVYHYVPALMVGVLLIGFAVEAAWAVAGRLGRRSLALALSVAWFAAVTWAFWYWGFPYAYGIKISPAEDAARKWRSRWW